MSDFLNKFFNRFFSNEESIYFAILLVSCFIFILLFGNVLLPVIISLVIAFLLIGLMLTTSSLSDKKSKSSGLFIIGGGVPKNFVQDTVVCAELLGKMSICINMLYKLL